MRQFSNTAPPDMASDLIAHFNSALMFPCLPTSPGPAEPSPVLSAAAAKDRRILESGVPRKQVQPQEVKQSCSRSQMPGQCQGLVPTWELLAIVLWAMGGLVRHTRQFSSSRIRDLGYASVCYSGRTGMEFGRLGSRRTTRSMFQERAVRA